MIIVLLFQVRDIMSLIVFCVVTERKQSFDTHPIRNLATNTMLKVRHQHHAKGAPPTPC